MTNNKITTEFHDKYENIKLIVEKSVQNIKNSNSAFLDAGGGKKSVIEFKNYKKVILDISKIQLSLNNNDATFIQADL